ncbi:MAG: GNAT family N-acetyltransferase [Selenomonadaceae bacterium]|nr:GNAT family N-acetyltransferase [Selenomonadaceae bacterium]
MNEVIRMATIDDAEQILKIYAYYVENTAISFECAVPTLENFRGRIVATLKKYPYLVAERGGKILGYAYAHEFVGRAAYDWSAELTIYLDRNERQRGLGRRLYEALEENLREMGILNLYACIGWTEREDEFLNQNSAKFHEHLGFRRVGLFQNCGRKFGRWYDMIWMEKIIGGHVENPRAVQFRRK